jgi:hypothetical protein
MDKVKELTPRGTHRTLEETIERINCWYVGWSSYFAMTCYPAQLRKIEACLSGDGCAPAWWLNKRVNEISIEN